MADQRGADRESTYKAARIGAGSRATVHCGVKNLSVTGARLRVEDPQDVPDTSSTWCSTAAKHRGCAG